MSIGRLAVNRPIAMLMLMCFVILLGVVSLSNLQMDLLPKISPPVIAVITGMPNAAPQEISTLVTEPLETIVGTVSGTKKINSRSQEGSSLIILEFDWRANLDEVKEEIKDKVALIPLPNDATKPMVIKFDPTSMPIMQLSVTADKELQDVQKYVEEVVAPKLDSIEGVASVDISGGKSQMITINMLEEELLNYNLSPETVGKMIAFNNVNLPAHFTEKDDKRLPIRVMGQLVDINELENLVVTMDYGDQLTPVYLKDIAEIKDGFAPLNSLSRTNGLSGINISLQKEGDSNLVDITQGILTTLSELEEDSDYLFTIAMNQGQIVEKSIANIVANLVVGAVLAILILLLFLKSPLSTLIIAVSIPFSIIATFVLMYFAGLTLNIMTLGGLALGVGMLVDNSIVVIENIYRHLQRGEETKKAAQKGVDEVAMAIIASTLTTMAVFLPVVFVGGLTGELFRELALTVSFSLLASLVVALTVIPMLASVLLIYRKGSLQQLKPWSYYPLALKYSLKFPLLTIGIVVALFILALTQYHNIGKEFIPEIDEGTFLIEVNLPEGTTLEKTNKEIEKVEEILRHYKEVDIVSARVGIPGGLTGLPRTNKGELSVVLRSGFKGDMTTNEVIDDIRDKLGNVEGDITFSQHNEMKAMAGSSQLQIVLSGPDLESVQKEASIIGQELAALESLVDVRSDIETIKPEAQIAIKQDILPLYGITTAHIAQNIKAQLGGETITYLNSNGNRVEVKMLFPSGEKNEFNQLSELEILTPIGSVIALEQVAEVKEGYGPRSISRENQKTSVLINGKIVDGDLGSVQKEVDAILENLNLPAGFTVHYGGAAQLMEEGFQGLKLAFFLAIALVYMIMAAQFESLLNPFIIIFTIPFAMIGVIVSLLITDRALGITAYIGIVMLSGIVVNNGIVMVDYINRLRKKGMVKEQAVIEGAQTRLRPILMTALTTILALVPLALGIGDGGELQAPMATTVIGGLIASTLLTLLVIPVLYTLLASKKV